VTRSTLGILIVTVLWIAVSVVAMTLATTTAIVFFLAVTIASFAVGKTLVEHRDH
jgi:membrane protein implicated in regulation of membrane protease activity